MVQEQAHRPHRRRRLTLIAGCALAAALLTACGSSASSSGGGTSTGTGSNTSAGSGSGQAPKAGGSVTVIEAGLDTQFDPALAFISTFTDGPEMEPSNGYGHFSRRNQDCLRTNG